MEIADYLLDGLEAALEVERELGVTTLEVDRALLVPSATAPKSVPAAPRVVPATTPKPAPAAAPKSMAEVVFLHDKPLSPAAVEMMAKILAALKLDATRAPIVIAPPIPKANIFVFLGASALRRYMPETKLAENMWGRSPKGKDILLVRDPEDIVRFSTVTPALQKIKHDLWNALKAIVQRLAVGRK